MRNVQLDLIDDVIYNLDEEHEPLTGYSTRPKRSMSLVENESLHLNQPKDWTGFVSLSKDSVELSFDLSTGVQPIYFNQLLRAEDHCDAPNLLRLTGYPYAVPEGIVKRRFYIDDVDKIYYFE